MFRLFKHYIPNAVLLLGLLDFGLLIVAAELGWLLRAHQIGMDPGMMGERWVPLLTFAVLVQMAMVSVGVYGSDALRSMRYATARLLVAVSFGIIALSVVYFLLPGRTLWRSNLFYAMFIALGLLVFVRLVLGGVLGTAPFRRRVLVLGAGARADRLRKLGERPEAGFVIVTYVAMSDQKPVIEEAISRTAIHNLTRFVDNLGVGEVVLALARSIHDEAAPS
jgi:FlaA1/EpsC-like NDP-sugar epimerase